MSFAGRFEGGGGVGGENEPTMLKPSSISTSGISTGEPMELGEPSVEPSEIPALAPRR